MTPLKHPRYKPRARFTLRALFVCITLFMLWGGYHTNRGRQERAAVQLLRESGAQFDQIASDNQITKNRFPGPYDRLVKFHHSSINDDFLTSLTPHPNLENLHIGSSQITPASLPALQKMPRLKFLQITSPNLTDGDKVKLKKSLPDVRVN